MEDGTECRAEGGRRVEGLLLRFNFFESFSFKVDEFNSSSPMPIPASSSINSHPSLPSWAPKDLGVREGEVVKNEEETSETVESAGEGGFEERSTEGGGKVGFNWGS